MSLSLMSLSAVPRRCITVSLFFLASVLMVLSSPVWFFTTLIIDGIGNRRFPLIRFLLFITWFLLCESVGILVAFALWLGLRAFWTCSDTMWIRANFILQKNWAWALGSGAFRIFGMRLNIEGDEDFRTRPIYLFPRHISTADTILSALTVSIPHDILLRYVLKNELLWDPCIDIVGNRLPNVFISRERDRAEDDRTMIASLKKGIQAGEGVLLYPEGTRYTEKKRRKILEKFAEKGETDALERAGRLQHLLPPKKGGIIQLLSDNPGADVVFMAHTGLEAATTFADFVKGSLIDTRVEVKFWRIPFEELPREESAIVKWLWQQWERMDQVVGQPELGKRA